MTTELRPFDLLLGELRASMPPEHFERVCLVLSSWSGQQVNVPAPRRWLIDAAALAAQRMHAQGVPTPVVRDRLVSMGVSRSLAYQLIARTKRAAHATA